MRIAFIISSLGYGGAERVIAGLAPRIRSLGHDVLVISVTDYVPLRNELDSSGVPLTTLGFSSNIYAVGSLRTTSQRLRHAVREFNPDLVHTNLFLADLLSRLSLPRGIPVVATLHGTEKWWMHPRRFKSFAKTLLDRWVHGRNALRFVAVSPSVLETAIAALHIKPAQCRIITNGVDFERFIVRSRQLSKPLTILQVGRMDWTKGHRTSLRAFSWILRKWPSARLVLAGDGPDRAALEEMAAELGMSSQVDFLGNTDRIPELLNEAHIYWMPSESEAWGVACIEALGVGVPVVISRAGGLGQIGERYSLRMIAATDWRALATLSLAILEDYEASAEAAFTLTSTIQGEHSADLTAMQYEKGYADLIAQRW